MDQIVDKENVTRNLELEEVVSDLSLIEKVLVETTPKSLSFHANEIQHDLKTDKILSLRCLICGQYQKNLKMLEFHMMHIHKSDESKMDDFNFNCPFCNIKFSTRKNRNAHMLMIHLTGKYKDQRCEICNKRLKSVESKNLHVQKYHQKL